jgi:hypothetical protein
VQSSTHHEEVKVCLRLQRHLDHVISPTAGVTMDDQKVCAVVKWLIPKSVHTVRTFLGLAGYYHRFINNYGAIATPLTSLLRKDGFRWCPEVEMTFRALQRALMSALVLQLSNFELPFIIECDTSGSKFGAVLHQGGGCVAFFSKQIAHAMRNWLLMSASSSSWCSLFAIGATTFGAENF